VVRVGSRVLEAQGDVHEVPPDADETGPPAYSRAAGPFVLSSSTYRYHADKRARRLAQLEAFAGALATRTSGEGTTGVILGGHLGMRAQARLSARKIPSLRLGAAWPLPRRLIEGFLRDKREVLVLEEGEPFLERELQGIALSAGGPQGPCRVRGIPDRRPIRLDEDRLENALRGFGAPAQEVRIEERDLVAWRTTEEALTTVEPLDMEPWPLFLARARHKLWGFAPNDPRQKLLAAIRASARPSIVVADPCAAALLGFRDQLIDVKAGFGQAPSLAAALTEASEIEERAGAPLCVALLGDLNLYQASLLGILDNVAHQRDVLHVILVREGSDAALLVKTLPEQLRAFGMSVRSLALDDTELEANLRALIDETGPRALVCLGAPGREDAIGG
jgi:TPP-dependent indolepyruvate ferredoxin oxidoreductase alpha subunit